MAFEGFSEVLRLAYDPRGVTSGLGKARTSAEKTRQTMDTLKRGLALASAAGAAFAGSIARDHEKSRSQLARTTNATGKELDRLQKAYLSTLGNVRSSSEETSATVAIMSKLTGASGPILVDAATAVERARKAFGTFDVGKLQGAMSAFNRTAEETPTILDSIGTVAGRSGVPIGTLIGQVQTFGPVLKNAGFTLEETVSLFGSFEAAGLDVTRVMPAINAAMRRAAVEGVTDLRGHLSGLMEQIRDAPTDVDALSIATEAFGAEGAQRMSVGIRSGAIPALDDLVKGFEGSEGATIRSYDATATWTDKLTGLRNKMASYVTFNPAVIQAVAGVATGIATLTAVVPGASAAFAGLWTVVTGPVGLAVAGIAAVGTALFVFRDKVADFGAFVVDLLTNKITEALGGLETVVRVFSDSLADKIAAASQSVVDFGANTQKSLADYAAGVRDAGEETEVFAGTLDGAGGAAPGGGPSLVKAEAGAITQTALLASGITVLQDRLKAAKETTRDTINALVSGTQSLNRVLLEAKALPAGIQDSLRVVAPSVASEFSSAGQAAESGVNGLLDTIRGKFNKTTLGGIFSQAFGGGGESSGGGGISGFLGGVFKGAGSSAGADFIGPPGPGGGGLLGGLLGKFAAGKGLLQKGISSVMNFAPIVGPLLSAFGPILMKGLGKLAGKAWAGIKNLFGGPSAGEVEGRKLAGGFRKGVLDGLSPRQMGEVTRAVESGVHSATGAGLHIAIRDAKLAGNATKEEAEKAATAMVAMLHKAEAEGPEAVKRAQAAINKIIGAGKEATDEIATDAEKARDDQAAGIEALSGQSEESLKALGTLAVQVYEDAGIAATDWANVAIQAATDVIEKFGEVKALLDGLAGTYKIDLALNVSGNLPPEMLRNLSRQVLRDAPFVRRDAGEINR